MAARLSTSIETPERRRTSSTSATRFGCRQRSSRWTARRRPFASKPAEHEIDGIPATLASIPYVAKREYRAASRKARRQRHGFRVGRTTSSDPLQTASDSDLAIRQCSIRRPEPRRRRAAARRQTQQRLHVDGIRRASTPATSHPWLSVGAARPQACAGRVRPGPYRAAVRTPPALVDTTAVATNSAISKGGALRPWRMARR